MDYRLEAHGAKVLAAVHESLDPDAPDCRRCRGRGSAALRERWGCDAPAPRPVSVVTCTECGGQSPSCATCEGTGREEVYRCAASLREGDRLVGDFLGAWSAWRAHGLLPDGGGYADQTRGFVRLQTLADAEAYRIRKQQDDAERRRLEAERRRSKLAGRAR